MKVGLRTYRGIFSVLEGGDDAVNLELTGHIGVFLFDVDGLVDRRGGRHAAGDLLLASVGEGRVWVNRRPRICVFCPLLFLWWDGRWLRRPRKMSEEIVLGIKFYAMWMKMREMGGMCGSEWIEARRLNGRGSKVFSLGLAEVGLCQVPGVSGGRHRLNDCTCGPRQNGASERTVTAKRAIALPFAGVVLWSCKSRLGATYGIPVDWV